MEVDHKGKGKGNGKGKQAKANTPITECCMCGKKSHLARDCWSRIHQDKTVHEVGGTKVDADAAKEFVLTIGNKVKGVILGHSGCERRIGDDRQRSTRQRLPQVVGADARTLQD